MKTFKDLVFHANRTGGINSRTEFGNGFSLSVIAGGIAYSTPRYDRDWETKSLNVFITLIFFNP